MLIGICGRAASGKSTVADHLISQGFVRVKFAGPLKDMLRAIGLPERAIEGDLKTTPMRILGYRTPRFAMQTLGTEWGRKIMGDGFWTGLLEARANKLLAHGLHVVCDDMRFPNEVEAIRNMGGRIIKVERPSLYPPKSVWRRFVDFIRGRREHASERLIDDLPADLVIVNDSDIAALLRCVEEGITPWKAC